VLGQVHKYFSKPRGPAVIFPSLQGPQRNLQQVQGVSSKIGRISHIFQFFFNGKTCRSGPRSH
jgi:hypothetical protein